MKVYQEELSDVVRYLDNHRNIRLEEQEVHFENIMRVVATYAPGVGPRVREGRILDHPRSRPNRAGGTRERGVEKSGGADFEEVPARQGGSPHFRGRYAVYLHQINEYGKSDANFLGAVIRL